MIAAIRKNLEQREEGFTLIELLVVVIIIGILAAIAIPTFLNQRERGWQSEVTSVVRNVALEVEAQGTAAGGSLPADLTFIDNSAQFGYGAGTSVPTLTYTRVSDVAFTLCGGHSLINGGTNSITYNNQTGGLGDFDADTACVATP